MNKTHLYYKKSKSYVGQYTSIFIASFLLSFVALYAGKKTANWDKMYKKCLIFLINENDKL